MPLVTRIIQAAVPLPEYAAVAKDQSLAGDSAFEITHATSLMQLTRVVDQLSQLSTVAAEMFADIAAISGAASKRIQDLQTRVQKIKSLVPQMESRIQEAVVTNELPAERTEWRTISSMSLNAFTKATANPTVTSVYYQTCEAPPDLNSLNSFRDDGKPCMMFYSYPEFFVEQWKILMIKEEEAIRKHRKAEKKQNRKNRKKLTKVRAVDVKRYNSTGELITSIAVDENAPVNQTSDMSSVKVSSQALHERPSISEPLDISPSPSIVPSPMSPWSEVSSSLDYHAGTAHRSAQKILPFLGAVVPPPPPPAPPAALAPPPPPPPPLKVVTGSEAGPKRTQSQSDLLSSIRGGEFKLKKVDERLLTPKTPDAAAGNDVAHILMRRAALEMSDSEDDSGSDDEEWD